MLWEVDIYPASGQPDTRGEAVAADIADLNLAGQFGLPEKVSVCASHGYLLQGANLDADGVERLARELLVDGVVETPLVAQVGDAALTQPPEGYTQLVQVLLKPGVTDTVAESCLRAIADLGIEVDSVRTIRKFWFKDLSSEALQMLTAKVLSNDAIEQAILGPLPFDHLELGSDYAFEKIEVPIRSLSQDELNTLSRSQQLYLQPAEMQTVQAYYQKLDREPSDIELETIAQTWSEHCSHKTLAGRIAYQDDRTERQFENMLKETIFAATMKIRETLGKDDWCVSVFQDNAGIVRFDETNNIVFKVETHNHPSALEPYGGANTGLGGVIRDPLGTGLGAKPICNTDVFCFAPPDTPADEIPPGTLHPRRVMKRVVHGVRDYGNRMGIPTVNGALYFDPRYLGNPLVYCGNVGLIPHDKSFGDAQPNDYIVALGGKTGRDGIHGATFSSVELTDQSESISGGAVQIGNAITEKMVLDVVLEARDQGLYSAITDCGAGGFSSAVGEMGEKIGAEVWLDKAPLKYDGLTYTEIWISEAQERMVLSVPEANWEKLHNLCASEGVEATVLGRFTPTGKLTLKYHDQPVGELAMEFLHDGRPPVIRKATYHPPAVVPLENSLPVSSTQAPADTLLNILSSLNVASKHWVIRQYDHEVQGGSVIKPLVGMQNDGPGDAAVVRPVLSSRRGVVVSCGMNPRYGDFDTYDMAASAIDEALRNCVAVGADPKQIAILDNFCWGDCEKPETLGSLVRAALACYDLAVELGTPFVSGKDSLNNEFSYVDSSGQKQTIAIPPSLLISALGQVADVSKCVTMDLKHAGNQLIIVGQTKAELGGSHFSLVHELSGGQVPRVDVPMAKQTFAKLHAAIDAGLVRACHDLSEGGLAACAAEMAFAGGLGAKLDLTAMPCGDQQLDNIIRLFSESNTRFLCEVPADQADKFSQLLAGVPHAVIGEVTEEPRLKITADDGQTAVISSDINELKAAWQNPLDW